MTKRLPSIVVAGDIVGAVLALKWSKNLSRWLCLLAWVFSQAGSLACYQSNGPQNIADDNATTAVGTDDKTTTYGYDRAGRAVKMVNGLGQSTKNTYDAAGRLKKREVFTTSANTTKMVEFTWLHDDIGNVTQQKEVWNLPAPVRTRTLTMTYDGANRLETEVVIGGIL